MFVPKALQELGLKLSAFPLHPRYARLFEEASRHECLRLAAHVAALSQDRSILLPIDDKRAREARLHQLLDDETEGSDILMELKAFVMAANRNFDISFCKQFAIHAATARKVAKMADQFLNIAGKQGLSIEPEVRSDWYALKKCIFIAFSDCLCKRLDKGTLRCALAHGRKGTRRRESEVDAEWFISTEIEERNVKGTVQVMLGRNSEVDPEWISSFYPGEVTKKSDVYWDSWQKRIRKTERIVFRDLALQEKEISNISQDDAATLIAKRVATGELKIKSWNQRVEDLIERINFVSQHFPEYEISPITREDRVTLLEQICYGATTEKDLNSLEVIPAIREWLTTEQLPMLGHLRSGSARNRGPG